MSEWFINLPIPQQIILIYFPTINIIAFFYFGTDKLKSQIPNKKRISEKTLWFLALLGGSIGALLAMYFFRHKTKKLSFQAAIAIILTIQIWIVYLIIN